MDVYSTVPQVTNGDGPSVIPEQPGTGGHPGMLAANLSFLCALVLTCVLAHLYQTPFGSLQTPGLYTYSLVLVQPSPEREPEAKIQV